MLSDRDQARSFIQDAIDALKRGDRTTAQRLAENAATLAPDWETPWLILTVLVGPEDSLDFIHKALKINPSSRTAQQALVWALERRHTRPSEESAEAIQSMATAGGEALPVPAEKKVSPASRPVIQKKKKVFIRGARPASGPMAERIARILGLEAENPDGLADPSAEPEIEGRPPAVEATTPPPAGEPGQVKPRRPLIQSYLYAPIALVILAIFTGISLFRTQLTSLWSRLVRVPPSPVAQCTQSILQVGEAGWPVATTSAPLDGSLTLPTRLDVAYWVDGTTLNHIFEVNPSAGSISSLAEVKPGDLITLTWADCSTEEFVVSAVDTRSSINASFFDQAGAGISILIPGSPSMARLVVRGVEPGTLIPVTAGQSDEEAQPVEVSLISQSLSNDGQTLTLILSIHNTGLQSLHLADENISLTTGNAAPLAPLSVVPGLPLEVSPEANQTLLITFFKPTTDKAKLKLLDQTLNIDQ